MSDVELERMAGGRGRGGVGIERGKGVWVKEAQREERDGKTEVKERKRVVRFMCMRRGG